MLLAKFTFAAAGTQVRDDSEGDGETQAESRAVAREKCLLKYSPENELLIQAARQGVSMPLRPVKEARHKRVHTAYPVHIKS